MQPKLVVPFLFLIVFGLRAQERAFLGPQFVYTFTGEKFHAAGGIQLEGMFWKHLSLNYAALYAPTGPDQYYFYAGGGQALGVYLIRKAFKERSGLDLAIPLGMLSFVLPESIAYRTPVTDDVQIGIFLAPYGYEVLKNKATDTEVERTSYALGLRVYLPVRHWMVFVPRVGMKGFYGSRALGGTFGLSFLFKVNKD